MVVYCFRLIDVFRAVDWLKLFARLKRLAYTVPLLSEHRLFVGHDLLFALVQSDDGLWRLGLEPRRQGGGAQMDPGDDVFRRGFRGSAPN